MNHERRYDIDWIRVIVFDILIIYHVGMFFVPWDWHIKNNELVHWLKLPMDFVSQWRLPVLFVVSGMGTRFALSQKTGKAYIVERFKRLFLPLLAGILIVVSPQVYIERISDGAFNGTFFDFLPEFFDGFYPEGNFSWHHLWFLPYLLVMSIAATPFFLHLRIEHNTVIAYLQHKIKQTPALLFLFALPLGFAQLMAPHFPVTHALIGDWYTLTFNFILFIGGFILVSMGEAFWSAITRIRRYALATGILCSVVLLTIWYGYNINPQLPLIHSLNTWSWILTILGYSAKYLNRESRVIKYRNRAVYPFYILHQAIIIVIGYALMKTEINYSWKIIIMTTGTFGITWAVYEFIIERIRILRPVFGLKNNR